MRELQPIFAYRCPSCMLLHDAEMDAADCCEIYAEYGWKCDAGESCEAKTGIHQTAREALECADRAVTICECGGALSHHAVTPGGWQGCYDIDCRCPKFEPADLAARR